MPVLSSVICKRAIQYLPCDFRQTLAQYILYYPRVPVRTQQNICVIRRRQRLQQRVIHGLSDRFNGRLCELPAQNNRVIAAGLEILRHIIAGVN